MRADETFVDVDEEPNPDLNRITNSIIGAAIAVHRQLGPGHLESAYEEPLAIEFDFCRIAYVRQPPVTLLYRGRVVGEGRLDFLVEGKVIVELKAIQAIAAVHKAQMISYLKITGLTLGIIINFNVPLLKEGISRIAN